MRVVLIAALLLSCSGKDKKQAAKPELKTGIRAPWQNPADDYPARAGLAPSVDAKALENPKAGTIVIVGATVMTAAGQTIENGMVVARGGAIEYVGARKATPQGATIIDASGQFVTPGIIDAHSHIGVYSSPHVSAHSDGNEATSPATADARALYGYWPQDPAITRARAGGITTALILPGSANLVGGLGQAVVMKPGRHAREVAFPGAPPAIKMACGENPKRVYGEKGGPQTRMGEYAAFRALFQQAAEYNAKISKYQRDLALWQKKREKAQKLDAKAKKDGEKRRVKAESAPDLPGRDFKLETLAAVLRGEVKVQIHCYRASEIAEMVTIAKEFGFQIAAFHHAVEAYKVRDILVANDIAIATWADWWGFKMEAFDAVQENAALFAESGGRTIIHSDSSSDIQRLNQEASKAYHLGRKMGIGLTENDALRWITANPAKAMGLDNVIGTLEKGKRADIVVWDKHPFSVYSRAQVVIQGGEVAYERKKGIAPVDFEISNSAIDPNPSAENK